MRGAASIARKPHRADQCTARRGTSRGGKYGLRECQCHHTRTQSTNNAFHRASLKAQSAHGHVICTARLSTRVRDTRTGSGNAKPKLACLRRNRRPHALYPQSQPPNQGPLGTHGKDAQSPPRTSSPACALRPKPEKRPAKGRKHCAVCKNVAYVHPAESPCPARALRRKPEKRPAKDGGHLFIVSTQTSINTFARPCSETKAQEAPGKSAVQAPVRTMNIGVL